MTGQAFGDEPEAWPVHSSEDVWRGSAPFAVRLDEISMPGEPERFGRLVLEHPGAVVVLAVDDDDRVLVLRQYRHAVEHRLLELPAGLLDQPDEDPLEAARRELLEEAGLEAGRWEHLTTVHNSPGITSERIVLYLAKDLRPGDRGDFTPAHEEADMSLHWVHMDDLLAAVLDGRATDGPLLIAVLLHALRRLGAGRV
jgi:8-oxo-dGDP phosphatase